MKPLITIIVPVYNVEKYIHKCIDSLISQTYENLEIILVNDGSTDNSPNICDEYAKKDSRIRVIHKENGGLSDARNVALDVAKGEYIGFVDSDDWVMEDMYEYLYNGIQEYSADIATCAYFKCTDKEYAPKYNKQPIKVLEGREAVENLLLLKIVNYACNKLYKKSLLQDIRYPKGRLYEDVLTTYKLFEKANLVVVLPEPKYYYLQRKGSITKKLSINNKVQSVESRIERFNILQDRYPKQRAFLLKDIYNYVNALSVSILFGKKKERCQFEQKIKDISKFLKQYKEEIWQECKFSPIKKLLYRFEMRGNTICWKVSAAIRVIIELKSKIKDHRLVKKIKKFIQRFKENNKRRYYYKKCTKLPLEEAAFIESRGGEDLAGNMFEIAQELCLRKIKVYLSVKSKSTKKVQEILNTGNFCGLEIVKRLSRKYYKALAISKYWFNDVVFETTTIKREGQVYINTWHGTPLKKIEIDVKEQRNDIGSWSRDMLKCDYVTVPSKYSFEKLLSSGCSENLFKGKALYSGYPRNSVFFDTNSRMNIRKELNFEDKEIFAYMPTWRSKILKQTFIYGRYSIEKILDFFEENLKENQIMLVKLHNYSAQTIDYQKYKKVMPFPSQYDTYSILNITDCLITDYSSVLFDYANTRNKIILFTYDKEEYMKDRGFYFDLEDLPFPKVETYEQLGENLNINKGYEDSMFIDKFCKYDCPDSVVKIINYIIDGNECCLAEEAKSNGKKNILLYDGKIRDRSNDTKDIKEIFEDIDTEKANYYYCFRQGVLDSTPLYIRDMPDNIHLFTFTKKRIGLWTEKIIMKITGKKYLKAQIKRELNRQIFGNVFDEVKICSNNKYDFYEELLKHYKDYNRD